MDGWVGWDGIGSLNALMLWAPLYDANNQMFHPHWHCMAFDICMAFYIWYSYGIWHLIFVWHLTLYAMKKDGDMRDHWSLSLLRQWRIVQSARGPEVQGSQDQSGNIQSLQVYVLIYSPGLFLHFNLFSLEFQMLQCRFATAYQPLQDMRAERNRQVASNHLFFKCWMIEQTGRGKQDEWQQKLQGLPTSDLPDQP